MTTNKYCNANAFHRELKKSLIVFISLLIAFLLYPLIRSWSI